MGAQTSGCSARRAIELRQGGFFRGLQQEIPSLPRPRGRPGLRRKGAGPSSVRLRRGPPAERTCRRARGIGPCPGPGRGAGRQLDRPETLSFRWTTTLPNGCSSRGITRSRAARARPTRLPSSSSSRSEGGNISDAPQVLYREVAARGALALARARWLRPGVLGGSGARSGRGVLDSRRGRARRCRAHRRRDRGESAPDGAPVRRHADLADRAARPGAARGSGSARRVRGGEVARPSLLLHGTVWEDGGACGPDLPNRTRPPANRRPRVPTRTPRGCGVKGARAVRAPARATCRRSRTRRRRSLP